MHRPVKIDLPKGKISGIYTIKNVVTGEYYVGSAINIRFRWYRHRHKLRKVDSNCTKLQKSWNKYGEKSFIFGLVEIVDGASFLIEREKFWIGKLDSIKNGMNVLDAGQEYGAGSREKMRLSSIGKKHSDETRARMSAAHKGKIKTQEHRANISLALTGRPLSEEHRAKCKFGRLGKKLTPEQIEKLVAPKRGKPRSPEVKLKISASLMGHSVSPETIKKRLDTIAAKQNHTVAADSQKTDA